MQNFHLIVHSLPGAPWAPTDANFVITRSGGLVEPQASAEAALFSEPELAQMIALARTGVAKLVLMQKAALG